VAVSNPILLVDDEIDLAELLCEFLQSHGYNVKTANSAKESMILASQGQFELVITDVQMPDKTGLEMISELNGLYPKMGFVIMSAHSAKSEAEILSLPGVFKFLHKPVSPPRFIEVIEQFFCSK
jgi:DNA-binding NtrC family response regulator